MGLYAERGEKTTISTAVPERYHSTSASSSIAHCVCPQWIVCTKSTLQVRKKRNTTYRVALMLLVTPDIVVSPPHCYRRPIFSPYLFSGSVTIRPLSAARPPVLMCCRPLLNSCSNAGETPSTSSVGHRGDVLVRLSVHLCDSETWRRWWRWKRVSPDK